MLPSLSRVSRAVAAGAAAAALALTGVTVAVPAAADTRPEAGVPATVSADSLPTVQIDGVVWHQAIGGGKVYAGGQFGKARPAGAAAGASTVTRTNLLRYDLATGVLDSSWAPNPNGIVRAVAVSPDGARLYVGGDFLSIAGVARNRIAAFDTATGKLVTTFNAGTNHRVRALVATNTTVYAGGDFTSANSSVRTRLAAFRATDGALLPWNPSADDDVVTAMALSPDGTKVVVGGKFTTFNAQRTPDPGSGYGLARVDATSGASLPMSVNAVVKNAGLNAGITSMSGDGSGFYGTGYDFGAGGNFEGAFRGSWDTGELVWMEDCHGDTYSVWPGEDAVYTAGHAHYCGNLGGHPQTDPWTFYRAIAFTKEKTRTLEREPLGYANFAGKPAPSVLHWYPSINTGTFTGQSQGAWTVTGNADYVLYAGEFTIVNNVRQQGLARFPRAESAPNKQGPRLGGTEPFVLTGESYAAGTVRLAWGANYDRDNELLTYEVLRNGTVVKTLTGRSSEWNRPMMGYLDEELTPGTSYRYRVRAKDPFGNSALTPELAVTAGSAGDVGAYGTRILADGATTYLRLGDAPGSLKAADDASLQDADVTGGVAQGADGIPGSTGRATTFNGTDGTIGTAAPEVAPDTFSAEAWFNTRTTTGGKIIGFGDKATGASVNHDRQVYMDNAGRLVFGVNPTPLRTVISPASYNDGEWHHVVATLGSAGMVLYVDGQRVGGRADVTAGQYFRGYWRVGGDVVAAAWANSPTSKYFAGSIDEVAIYNRALDATTVADHSVLGRTGVAVNQVPVAAFEASAAHLTVTVDASASTDADGDVVSYAWDFGDGATAGAAAAPTATHDYAQPGTYTVTVTVTDDAGASSTSSSPVTVTAPPPANRAPTAAFTAEVSDLDLSVDGSGSTDPEGAALTYQWNFGDGATGSGPTATHTYAAAGPRTVTLTVTDPAGASHTTTREVTPTAPVQPPAPGVLAADSFGRTVASGWGAADVGGQWTVAGGGAGAFSVAGGAGLARGDRAGWTLSAQLNDVAVDHADVSATMALDKIPTSGGHSVEIVGRSVGSASYRLRTRVLNTGVVRASLNVINGTDTVLRQVNVPNLTYAAGDELRVRLQVVGTGTTALRAKVWRAGEPEPTAWLMEATNTTGALQAPGRLGVSFYVSGATTSVPVTMRLRDFAAVQVAP